jgi:uncharacterized protein (TIGR03643 family)
MNIGKDVLPETRAADTPKDIKLDAGALTNAQISEIIELAWDDEVSFDMIRRQYGLSEPEVKALMRSEMKPSSFRMWRKRVSGRQAKHDLKSRHDS